MQQQSTFNFGLTKNFFLICRTLSMRQKTKNDRNQGSNAKQIFLLVLFPSPLPRWVRLVQKTRAKNSHAWAPLRFKAFSPVVRIGTPPPPHPQGRFTHLWLGGGGYTLACGRGDGGGPNSDEGTDTVVLYRHIFTLWG
jgi:hypothetical protein